MKFYTKEKRFKEKLIFLHIPKTAGSTIQSVIRKQYKNSAFLKNEDRLLTESEKMEKIKDADYIRVHYIFGVHQLIKKPFTYITFLREPVDRFISEYYYARRKEDDAMYQITNEMELEEFVQNDSLMSIRRFNNYQTHFISGAEPPNLALAKENIDNYFSFIGLTERFDESLKLLKKQFGWRNINYKKRNVTTNRPTKDQLPKEVIKKIEEYNQLDIELYEYAKQIFEKQLEVFS